MSHAKFSIGSIRQKKKQTPEEEEEEYQKEEEKKRKVLEAKRLARRKKEEEEGKFLNFAGTESECRDLSQQQTESESDAELTMFGDLRKGRNYNNREMALLKLVNLYSRLYVNHCQNRSQSFGFVNL